MLIMLLLLLFFFFFFLNIFTLCSSPSVTRMDGRLAIQPRSAQHFSSKSLRQGDQRSNAYYISCRRRCQVYPAAGASVVIR